MVIAVTWSSGSFCFFGSAYIVGAMISSSSKRSSRLTSPSTMISAWAGTVRSTVSQGIISTSMSMRVPTISISPHVSMCRPEKLAMIS